MIGNIILLSACVLFFPACIMDAINRGHRTRLVLFASFAVIAMLCSWFVGLRLFWHSLMPIDPYRSADRTASLLYMVVGTAIFAVLVHWQAARHRPPGPSS